MSLNQSSFHKAAAGIGAAAFLSASALLPFPAAAQQLASNYKGTPVCAQIVGNSAQHAIKRAECEITEAQKRIEKKETQIQQFREQAGQYRLQAEEARARGAAADARAAAADARAAAGDQRAACSTSLVTWAKGQPKRIEIVKGILAGRTIQEVDTCAILQQVQQLGNG